MFLTRLAIDDWINSLKLDANARIEPANDDKWNPAAPGITWGLSVGASAYVHIESDAQEAQLRRAIPSAFRSFDRLTGEQITHYQDGDTGKRHPRTGSEIANLEEQFLKEEFIAGLNAFSGNLREASPQFAFDAIHDFHPTRRPGTKFYRLGYVSVRVPPKFFAERRRAFDTWWREILESLAPVQAYLSLGVGLPPVLEAMGDVEPAEYFLAKAFLGLDIDKPYFMRSNEHDGLHLEEGMRTPSYGVLVRGPYLEKLGGATALRKALSVDPAIRIVDCAGGLWIEAGDAPRLYPVEEGLPASVSRLAQALKPVRLERMQLTGMLQPVPRPNSFDMENSAQWLARFDAWQPSAQASRAPGPILVKTGEPAPHSGVYAAHDGLAPEVIAKQGDPLPEAEDLMDPKRPKRAFTWILRQRDDGGPVIQ
jgi:hypothetical protein